VNRVKKKNPELFSPGSYNGEILRSKEVLAWCLNDLDIEKG